MSKKISFSFIGIVVLLLAACSNSSTTQKQQEKNTTTILMPKKDSVKYTVAMVDNKKDPTCGMPVSAGIEDTIHYKKKAIGFCSKECKNDFIKNASIVFASIEWKNKTK